ncbi:MAG: acyl-CoA thioesterase II [Streptosporangiales bacterium]|nr:acyl-CoA thioesterase II [Streptosporangiales bacterium]MBO0891937.1 acyl-CoA thioesterase II [Acidothermales bacterium]
MPQSIEELVGLLELEEIEPGLYRGRQPETELQRVFGGQVAGQALSACISTVPEDRYVHSLHGYFLRAGDPTVPIVYDVERIRDGRSFSDRRVVARQHTRVIFYMTASFQIDEPGLEHQDVMPDTDPPERTPSLGHVLARVTGRDVHQVEREWAALDVRYGGDSRPAGIPGVAESSPGGTLHDPAHPALARVWLKAAGPLPDDRRLHACVLTYASDLTLLAAALVPHGLVIGSAGLQTASLDHAIWFHRPFRADEWLLYDQVSPSASGARGLVIGRLFDRSGRLVATVVQEGLIRKVGGD